MLEVRSFAPSEIGSRRATVFNVNGSDYVFKTEGKSFEVCPSFLIILLHRPLIVDAAVLRGIDNTSSAIQTTFPVLAQYRLNTYRYECGCRRKGRREACISAGRKAYLAAGCSASGEETDGKLKQDGAVENVITIVPSQTYCYKRLSVSRI